MKIRLAFLLCLYLMSNTTRAQSSNIDCANAFEIDDPKEYCSGVNEFDSEDVGDSGEATPPCWSASNNDLWFTFVAEAKSVNIIVSGEEGTMDNPEIILYEGNSCSSLFDINSCEINESTTLEITSLNNFNLAVGQRYFIRVDGRSGGNDGSFQICVTNYNPPALPGQDCNTASLLCNKDPFTVFNVTGEGFVEDEADGTCLDVGPNGSENRSVWYKWTCSVSGTLTFDIIPISPEDDYDFGIFELPDGISSCNKNLIRCGATDGGDGETCGPNTGLDLTSTDTEEDQNCEADEDGYLRFIDMVAGQSYAILINNFSSSELGFNMSFGGSGEFQGPQADFEIAIDESDPCSPSIIVSDATILGVSGIAEINWNFGVDASPPTATGAGPISVSYSDFGEHFISLEVISDLGCIVYQDSSVVLDQCSYTDVLSLDIVDLQGVGCGESGTGRLELSTNFACGDYMFGIGGVFTDTPIFENLDAGDLNVTVIDENGCTLDSIFNIPQTADFTVDAGEDVTIQDPSLGIQLDASTTAVTDVTISWSPATGVICPDGSTNCLNPQIDITEETIFTITIIDENGCVSTDEVTVSVDLCGNSTIGITLDSIRAVTCAGGATGFIQVAGEDGAPGYMYSIDSKPFTTSGTFDNLIAGSYFVQVQDENFCTFGIIVEIVEVPDFDLDAGDDITLNLPGDSYDPTIITDVSGNFQVTWSPETGILCPDGTTNCINPTITPSETTTYNITIVDENGCVRTDEFTIVLPDVCANSNLSIQLDSIRNDYCNGAIASYLQVSGVNGFPDYLYSINGSEFETDSIFIDLAAGNYTIDIQDRFNCTQSISVTIEEEPAFIASAGNDITINGTEPFENLNGSHEALGNVTITWSPGSGIVCQDSMSLNCLKPLVNPEITTTYILMVTDEDGCVATDEVTVRVVRNEDVYGPNVFSPNEDGVNDFFSVFADPDVVEIIEDLSVFDRWGNKVFERRNLSPADASEGWNGLVNGSKAEQGVYIWYATIKFILPPSDSNMDLIKTVSGDVTLIR